MSEKVKFNFDTDFEPELQGLISTLDDKLQQLKDISLAIKAGAGQEKMEEIRELADDIQMRTMDLEELVDLGDD